MTSPSEVPTRSPGTTWAATHKFRAHELLLPRSVDEVADVVRRHDRIRALGTRHSFSDIADSEVMLTITHWDPQFVLDESAEVVSVNAGTRYGILARWLQGRGYALHNTGSLPHISIAGALSTGTHGSGDRNGILPTAVTAVQIVTATGDILEADDTHPAFPGMLPSLGSLGVITRVSLRVQPTYLVRQDVYENLRWQTVLDNLDVITGSGYSVSLFTSWAERTIGQALIKTRVGAGSGEGAAPPLLGVDAREDLTVSDGSATNRTQLGGVPGPWSERLPHFRLDAEPSHGSEIQSEYFVDRKHGSRALEALRMIGKTIDPLLITSEIRTTAADALWLSMANGRDSLAIHFTWKNLLPEVTALLPAIEAALAPFEARPHWGKVFAIDGPALRSLYPRMNAFEGLRASLDPDGKFSNDFTARILSS